MTKMESGMQNKRDLSRERDRDRSRRGDRPSRFSDVGSRDKSRDREERRSGNRRLYVSNIPYDYRWQELKDLFREQVGEVSYVELFSDDKAMSKGCGLVEFASEALAEKALTVMQRYEIKGRKILIKEDPGNEHIGRSGNRQEGRHSDMRDDRRPNTNFSDHLSTNPTLGNSASYNTFGLSLSFLENLGITEPLQSRVFVANLDYKVDAKKLKEVFRLAGKVQNVDLSVDKDGNSRGFAVIEFDHPVESVQAISMLDHQMLYDRRMTVRMDRTAEKLDHSRLPEGLKGIGQGLGPNGEPLRDVAHNLPQSASNISTPLRHSMPPPQQTAPNMLGTGVPQALNLAALSNVVGGNLANLGNIQSLAGSLGALSNPLLASAIGSGDFSSLGIGNSLANAGTLSGLNSMGTSNSLSAGNLATINNLTSAQNSQMGSLNRDHILSQSQSFGLQNSNAGNNLGGYVSDNFAARESSNFSGDQLEDSYNRPSDMYSSLGNGRMTNSVNLANSHVGPTTGRITSDTLLIRELPFHYTWQDLRDKFKRFGAIKNAEIINKDTGIVQFNTEHDAIKAYRQMDMTRLDGQKIKLSYYRM